MKDNFLKIALIPARSGSQGLKNKNIKKLNGKELIYYSIQNAKILRPDRIIVSTDSIKIKNIALKYGAEVPFLRPKKISNNDSTDLDVFKHFIDWYKEKYDLIPEIIYHLRITTPFRREKNLIKAKEIFLKNNTYSSLRSFQESTQTPYKIWKISKKIASLFIKSKREMHSMGRQFLPKTYYHIGYIDILRTRKTILKNTMTGNKVYPFLPIGIEDYYIDIDNKKDFDIAKKIKFNDKNIY